MSLFNRCTPDEDTAQKNREEKEENKNRRTEEQKNRREEQKNRRTEEKRTEERVNWCPLDSVPIHHARTVCSTVLS